MLNFSSSNTKPLYTQRDVTEAARIKYETLRVWLDRGLVLASYTLGDRPVFSEQDKEKVVRFAEARREQRGLSTLTAKLAQSQLGILRATGLNRL